MNSAMVWNCLAEPPLTLPGEASNSSGSVNSWIWPISETSAVNAIVGRSAGSVMCHSWRQVPARSSAAASNSSFGIACIAPR